MLTEAENVLLRLITPGGHFLIINTLSRYHVTYDDPQEVHRDFMDREDPRVGARFVLALESLVVHKFIKKNKTTYTLTTLGEEYKESQLPPSD